MFNDIRMFNFGSRYPLTLIPFLPEENVPKGKKMNGKIPSLRSVGVCEENSSQNIRVIFLERNLSRLELLNEIGAIQDPQVLFWYIGENGFKLEGVNYYKRDLGKVLKLDNNANCILYDLTAWSALRDRENTVENFNTNVTVISEFAIPRLSCVKSSDFFKWLQTENNPSIISYFRENVLKRKVLFSASREFPDTNMTIGEVFRRNCPILEDLYAMDSGKCYSLLQYIEGCYLINRIIEAKINDESDEINIVFALPNDEWKYYKNPEESFSDDVAFLIQEKFGERLANIKINVFFYTFNFGKESRNRPYNAGSKTIDLITRSQLV